jgi:threonine synthase
MRGKRGINVFMLSPHGRMSPFQQAQMYSLGRPNIHNIAIEGVFDDCQDIVQAVAPMPRSRRSGSSAPSIRSTGRASRAQVVYLLQRYFAVTKAKGELVDFAFRPATSATSSPGTSQRSIGLPIRRLVLATNENDVLDEFFRTARIRRGAPSETHATSQPVDGHLEGVELRALHLRRRRPQPPGARMLLWDRLEQRGDFDLANSPHWDRVVGTGSCRDAARMPIASRRFAMRMRATASSSIPILPMVLALAAPTATPRSRLSASRRHRRRSSRRRFVKR